MTREIIQSPAFVRNAKKLLKKHSHLYEILEHTFSLLEQDAYDPKLRSHKLKGDLQGSWACSVAYDLRIVFTFVEEDGEEQILLQRLVGCVIKPTESDLIASRKGT